MIPPDERLPALRAALWYGWVVAVAAAWVKVVWLTVLYVIAEVIGGK
jgi:hypothetical protein